MPKKTKTHRKDVPDYSDLNLRWEEELAFFVAMNKYKIFKEELPSGDFEYRVHDSYGQKIVTVVSARNVMFSPKKRRRRKKRRND